MKRRSVFAVIAAVLCMIMVVAMLLPMSVSAADESVKGIAFSDQYFRSEWKGSTIKPKTSWGGQWVTSDSQYAGVIQWTSEHEKVSLDPDTGVLTIKEASASLYMIFRPDQAATNPLGEGPSYCSIDLLYDPSNFSGFSIGASGAPIFSANTDGSFYVGTNPGAGKTPVGKLAEGWNTVEFIMLAYDAAGKLVQNGGGLKQSEVSADQWPVKRVDTFVRVNNAEVGYPESRAFTTTDLEKWTKIENFKCGNKFFKDQTATKILPISAGKGQFSITNVKAVLLNIDQDILQYRYNNGNGEVIMQSVPAASDNKEVTVPAGVKADGTPVVNWYNEELKRFLKPGDTVTLSENATFIIPTGEVEAIGLLGAAVDRVREDLASYTYVELQAELDNLNAAADAAKLDASHEYMKRKEEKVIDIRARMNDVKNACEEAIALAAIFSSDAEELADRIVAYEDCQMYLSDLDATYSDATADAIDKLNKFETRWIDAGPYYEEFEALCLQVATAAAGEEKNDVYLALLKSFNKVAEFFPTFMLSDAAVADFEANIAASQAQFNELATVTEMYDYLFAWAETWNTYCTAQYMGRVDALPAALAESVQKYNDAVKALNNEFAEAVIVCCAVQKGPMDAPHVGALISDIYSKYQYLFDDSQSEEE